MPQKRCSPVDVIVDARMITHSGIGTYLQGLLVEYARDSHTNKISIAIAVQKQTNRMDNTPFEKINFDAPIYSLQEQMGYLFHIKKCRLWHAPHYNIPLFKGKTKLVVTVHDLIHWIFRKDFFSPIQTLYAKTLFQRTVRLADRIIAVSSQTRDDLIQYFDAKPEKIRVIAEGVTDGFLKNYEDKKSKLLEKYSLPERFFLYVGLLKPHKNVNRLIEIFRSLRSDRKINSSLVIVGKKDKKYRPALDSLRRLKTEDGIYYLPYLETREELAGLYASARALVHPSLYEGFGLTCLEAMAAGCPVIASKVASLPEVIGEAGYYIDPYRDDSIRQSLLELEENDSLRRELSEKGRMRARQFSWAKAAHETLQTYNEVLNS